MIRTAALCSALLVFLALPAQAEWKPANDAVAQAARDPLIAGALAEAARLDTALIEDDHAAFADFDALEHHGASLSEVIDHPTRQSAKG
jgi:hypothetical protein